MRVRWLRLLRNQVIVRGRIFLNKVFNLRDSLLYAAFFILLVMSLPLASYAQKPTASALHNPSSSTSSSEGACCGYWAAVMRQQRSAGSNQTPYAASNAIRSQLCS